LNITATIQARMGSSRLPGKVLADVCGKPMLLWQVERIRRSRLVDRVVIGTSTSVLDDQIVDFCSKYEIECYRGSENDVLERISSLLLDLSVDLHVECYGDSPLIDPQIIDEFIGFYLKYSHTADYFSSALQTTYPPGLEVTVYPARILIEVNQLISSDDPMREHVGYNITRFPDLYKQCPLLAPCWFSNPETYLEVDTPEDLALLRNIVSHFSGLGQSHFSLGEILSMLRQFPHLVQGNLEVERRWKKLREQKNV
jgi:spore coat polysaccharide biosynthesis protein SpsF